MRCKFFAGEGEELGVREFATGEEIANLFSLSERTVKNHLYSMKRKVGGERPPGNCGRLPAARISRPIAAF